MQDDGKYASKTRAKSNKWSLCGVAFILYIILSASLGLFVSLVKKQLLAVDLLAVVFNSGVVSITVQFTRLDVILHYLFKHEQNLLTDMLIVNRRCYLYPAQRVSRHEISRGNVDLCRIPLSENIYSRMLQIAPDNADHADILCFTLNTRDKAAYPADRKLDLHSRL